MIILPKHLDPSSLDRFLALRRHSHREESTWYFDVGELVASEHRGAENALFLEFGTASGRSARWLSSMYGIRGLYCFDTFDGLPEAWGSKPAGSFSCGGKAPALPFDCRVVEGLFQDTLPGFLADNPGRSVAFAHIDCDLYSSTAFVLQAIAHRLLPGAMLLFDELFDYQGLTLDHEARAFMEWYRSTALDLELVMTCNAPDISGKALFRVVNTNIIHKESYHEVLHQAGD